MSEAVEYADNFQRAWWAVVARFLIHGLVTATWVSRIPSVKSGLHLGDGVFGFCLFGTAIGSLVGIPVCGWAVTRYGSRRACAWTSVGYCLAMVLPAFAFNAWTLFGALFLFGAMAGSNDVAMNAQAVAVERLMGSPTMSRFHAMFSIGGIAGAAAGGWIAAHGIPVTQHFVAMGALFLTFAFTTAPLILETPSDPSVEKPTARVRLGQMPVALLALCGIGFCIFLAEGAMADWTAIYLRQILHSGPGMAAAGYAVFSAAMSIFRLCGDAITLRLGPAWTIRGGALLAAFGLSSALVAPSPAWALPGIALVGAGFSSIIPLVFAAGGRIPSVSEGAGVAAVSGLGYMGFLVGPTAIGFLSELTSLRVGLCLVVALSLITAGLVSVTEREPA